MMKTALGFERFIFCRYKIDNFATTSKKKQAWPRSNRSQSEISVVVADVLANQASWSSWDANLSSKETGWWQDDRMMSEKDKYRAVQSRTDYPAIQRIDEKPRSIVDLGQQPNVFARADKIVLYKIK